VWISLDENISPQPEHSRFDIIDVISANAFSFASRLAGIFILVLYFNYNHIYLGIQKFGSLGIAGTRKEIGVLGEQSSPNTPISLAYITVNYHINWEFL